MTNLTARRADGADREGCSRRRWLAAAALSIAIGTAGAESQVEQGLSVTPYRPTVSTPASLSVPGWLEVEAGLQQADAPGGDHRDSAPYSLKLALSEDWGVRIGGEAWVRDASAPTSGVTGVGDTSFILKRRFALNPRAAFGVELGVTAPTAPAGAHSGSGKTDYTLTGIYSADFGSLYHADLNLGVTQLGAVDPSVGRRQMQWAAALSAAINPRWGLVTELSGTRQPGAAATCQILGGATFSPGKRATWDLGMARGLTTSSPSWTLFAGVTFLVARMF